MFKAKQIKLALRTTALCGLSVFGLSLNSATHAAVLEFIGSAISGPEETLHILANSPSLGRSKDYVSTIAEGRFKVDGTLVDMFCIELYQDGVNSNYTVSPYNDNSLQRRLINRMYDNFYNAYRSTAVGSAAMQAVVWEIMEDTANLNILGGNFRLGATSSQAVVSLASTMLTTIASAPDTNTTQLTVYRSPTNQDRVSGAPVPLPGTALLLGLGTLGLWFKRRKC